MPAFKVTECRLQILFLSRDKASNDALSVKIHFFFSVHIYKTVSEDGEDTLIFSTSKYLSSSLFRGLSMSFLQV